MLVVLAIITIITAVVITSHSAFNKTLLLTNTAYDVALTIRGTATYGIGSRTAGPSINTGYGIHIQKSAAMTTFSRFADSYPLPSASAPCHPATDTLAPDAKPGDCAYNPGQEGPPAATPFTLGNGMTITDFCVTYAVGSPECASGSLTSLDIVFVRPNPQPYMSVNGTYAAGSPVTSACLALTSPQGGARFVSIALTGEINSSATSCL